MPPTGLERLRLLAGLASDEWIKAGRFEVNRRTGERRPIADLELGPAAEDVLPEREGTTWGKAVSATAQGFANLPGYAAEGAMFMANNQPGPLAASVLSGALSDATGFGNSYEEQRKGQEKLRNTILDPYRRATAGIGPEIPKFSDAPLESTILGGLQSLPQTALIALTGGRGAIVSGAQQADQAYQEMKGRGVPDFIAIPTSTTVGTLQGLLDKIGAEGAFKGLTGNFAGRALKGGAIEGVTETAQELISLGGESATGKDQKKAEVLDRLSASFAGGFLPGAALGASPRISGINESVEVPVPVIHQEATAIEQKLFPQRRAADYARLALEQGPKKALARGLNDLSLEMDPDIKWEMLLDDQTNLALGREWQKIKTRVDADPSMAIVDVDLDGVKAGNDALGHDVADELIFKPSTEALHQVAEKYGISPRLRIRKGGDEFRIVVPANAAEQFAKDLQEAMPPRFIPLPPGAAATAGMPDGAYIQHGASIGWGATSQEADQSMYRSKESKPNRGALSPGQPPFVSQSQAEEQVIQHEAQQAVAPRPNATSAEPRPVADRYAEFKNWADEAQAAIRHFDKKDPDLAAAMRRAYADRVADYTRSDGTVVPTDRRAKEIDFNSKQLSEGAPTEAEPLSTREALAATGALMAVPVDQINAAVDGARGLLARAEQLRQKYATAEGNLPIPWMQAHERTVQAQRAAKLEVDYLAQDYSKALAQEIKSGAAPEEVNHRSYQYLNGDTSVDLPAPIKTIMDKARSYYDGEISQKLVDSRVARNPAQVQEILNNQGRYIYRAFKMHIEPDWAKKMVGTPTFEAAVDDVISREDGRFQKILETRNELAQEYEGKIAEVEAELAAATAQPVPPGDIVPHGMQGEASRIAQDVRQGGTQEAQESLLALREQCGRKLGRARAHATWAQKKVAENAADPKRRDKAAGWVENLISFDPKAVNPKGFKGMSKAWLSKRKDIPKPILDVMGVIDDPITGLAIVAERAARSIGRKAMWDDIVLGSEGVDVAVGSPMPGLAQKIEGVTTIDANGKEQDVYTSKELLEAIDDAFNTAHQSAGLWDMINGGLKANATIFNLQGAMRNAESGLVPLMANGNFIPAFIQHAGDAFKLAAANVGVGNKGEAWEQFKHGPVFDAWRIAGANASASLSKQMRQEAIDAVNYGVLGTTVDTRDAAQYFKTIVEDPVTKTPFKSAFNFAQKVYAWGDNMAKLVAWKAERDRYAKAYDLPRDSPEVKARAAEVVKRTIQNYDRLPKWAKEARKSPVIGPFVSFPASVISNVGGIAQTVAEDLKSDNPKIRKAGWVRAVYATGVLGGIAFYETFARMFKDDEEDEVAVLDSARKMLPPWMKNSALKLYGRSPGQISVIDLSFLNYYDTVTRPIAMIARGDLAPDQLPATLVATGWEMAKKIFGEELALAAYADFTRGPVGGGPEIVNEEMSGEVGIWRTLRYAMRTMAPGTLRSAVRILEAQPGHRATEVAALAGPRVTTIPVSKAFDYSLHELADDRVAIRTSLQGALKSTALLALPEFKANVDGFVPSMTSIHAQAVENYQAAIKLGVEPKVATAQLADKFDKRGKIMASFLNLGSTPESAVQKAVEYEWTRLKPDLLVQVTDFQRAALEDYKSTHPTATSLAIERRRLELEDWGRNASGIINSVQIAPPQGNPMDRLRKLGGLN